MRFLVFALTLLVCGPAQADRFAAAGRIENALSQGTCSASLIAPDIIITAAHCVNEEDTFLFRLGSQAENAPVQITRVAIHPLYTAFREHRFRRLSFDIAVGKLSEPFETDAVAPFRLGVEAEQGEGLFVVSWRRGSGPRPRQRRCAVIEGRIPAVVTLGCRVYGGESGAPLLRLTPDGTELVAILNSRLEQDGKVLAVASNARIRAQQLIELLESDP